MLQKNGFSEIRLASADASRSFVGNWAAGTDISDNVVSENIEAIKPAA